MSTPLLLESRCISEAWLQAFETLLQPGVGRISPMIVSIGISDTEPIESEAFREALNKVLDARGRHSVQTTANTIFPKSMWNPSYHRSWLFERYLWVLSKLKKMTPANRNGTYFGRLIHYHSGNECHEPVNQLEHIIQTYQQDNHRLSALQATIFDPYRDHTHQRQRGFPCLQHVLFTPDGPTEQLAVTGIYATQYIFDRAYGNYLGLYYLGQFMAHELGLNLRRVNCIATPARLERITKGEGRAVAQQLRRCLE